VNSITLLEIKIWGQIGLECNRNICEHFNELSYLERGFSLLIISVRMWFYMTLSLSKMCVMKSKLREIIKSMEHKREVFLFQCQELHLWFSTHQNEIIDVINTGHQQQVNWFTSTSKIYIHTGLFISPSGMSNPCGTVAGMVTLRGACQQRERHSKFLSYLTGARYVHPWWHDRCKMLANSNTHSILYQ
jgi:hypothetical protein